VKTSWNPYLIAAFESIFRPWMHRRIAALHVRGSLRNIPRDRRVILAANHVSWWDAFLLRELHRKAGTGLPIYTLMRSDRLARFPFFAGMGVIGLTREPSAVMHALRYLAARRTAFWLSFFPQGRIWPSWKRSLGFRRGLEVFARELAPCTIVPVALHLEHLTTPAPSAFIGIGEPFHVESGAAISVSEIERSVEHILDDLADVLADHGEEAGVIWDSPVAISESG
jgi:1-acyl-sn-glycerol-3-phosphate acyltransferase